ncbi:hypothetical protein LEP1GSC060_3943 [Leptospira weilii serovar Ranarum str. ICFT]|uniref:Uncharacterized protein n=1 Tax=Leptospira weilii serovar Ranarum str. ICFT TaxID=1218598 RepID=N1WHN1_9LEPT|nr:hypothetical protein LEP1GSC060_3943 [Leptospira weilii serovar Ranarum str. ICFT]
MARRVFAESDCGADFRTRRLRKNRRLDLPQATRRAWSEASQRSFATPEPIPRRTERSEPGVGAVRKSGNKPINPALLRMRPKKILSEFHFPNSKDVRVSTFSEVKRSVSFR